MFGDDPRVDSLCSQFSNCTFTLRPLKSWDLYTTFPRIKKNLEKKRGRFQVPEFFSEDYIYLQLLKFECVKFVSLQGVWDSFLWIDAGLYAHLLPHNWKLNWLSFPDKIHALQIGPKSLWERWILETPTVSIAGGCWGGSRKAMNVLCTRVLNLHKNVLDRGMIGNDQQYLSILFQRHPEDFFVKRSYVQYAPFYSSQNYNGIVDAVLNESFIEKGAGIHISYYLFYLLLVLCPLFFFFAPK